MSLLWMCWVLYMHSCNHNSSFLFLDLMMSPFIHCLDSVYMFVCGCYMHKCHGNVVYIQGVRLRSGLKLIQVTSLSSHVTTSQGHICVPCVTNALQAKEIWAFTKEDIQNKACIHVRSVRNNFIISSTWSYIWFYIAANTSAWNVERTVAAITC